MTPDHAEQAVAEQTGDNAIPTRGYQLAPLVGLGGSAGAIPALKIFFENTAPDSGQAFVVVLHLAPEHVSSLAGILQTATTMPVRQVTARVRVEPNHVYVIPPRKAIQAADDYLVLSDEPLSERGRHVAVDVFFRTLADSYGPHAAAVVLSGGDSDGAIGIKRIKERGGLTVAQDPHEAEHPSMPRAAVATGMVDWVLPAGQIALRVKRYFELEKELKLPPEELHSALDPDQGPPLAPSRTEAGLADVLQFLRARTGRDFSAYKRATVVRRIARRMQVNGHLQMGAYLDCLRTTAGEAGALLQDLLISVTNFFRDGDCFAALDAHLGDLFKGKGPRDSIRVWVPACATGEEAYSLAIVLSEKAQGMEAPPLIQVFATDLDGEAVRKSREGRYPTTIEADVSEDRLRRFFVKEQGGYKVRREIREMVLFAEHDVLRDSPFSRVDLISCRNLLIYLNRDAQRRVFDLFHFALVPQGHLFLGSSESAEDARNLFSVVDKKHRIFVARLTARSSLPFMGGPGASLSLAGATLPDPSRVKLSALYGAAEASPLRQQRTRGAAWSELHFKLLESLAPPSVLIDADEEILHLSPSAGRFLQFSGGEPSRNLLTAVLPGLRVELRAALYRAAQGKVESEAVVGPVDIGGADMEVAMRVSPAEDLGSEYFMVVFSAVPSGRQVPGAAPAAPVGGDPVAHQLDRELERSRAHLRHTVEQYEASAEDLKSSNEELQAMNEELRSATEELETSREELQSINEELSTVNQELKSKVEELGHSNSDLHNLMDATAIATVFMDRGLRITRYTPAAVTLFNLIATDLGRPLADLATRLDYPQLRDDALQVLDKLVPIEREVGVPQGLWFLARLLPYRTLDDHIAGVVVSFIDITARKQAEEVRLWLSAVVASSSDAIISFSRDQTILSWNAGAEGIFGYSAAETIGQPLSLLAPDWGDEQADLIRRVRGGYAVADHEALWRCKDGREVRVALSVSPIKDAQDIVIGSTAIARDITAEKQAAEALRASEERLRLMVENATDYAIFSTDLERKVTFWNSGAQRLLGYAEAEVLGRSADIIFTAQDRAAGAPETECGTALSEGRAADDREHQRKDGSRFWASGVMMLMRDTRGEAIGFVKILRDQTAELEAKLVLQRSQADLTHALEENESSRADLQAADFAKDRFLAVLSHELRNPLASIDSAAALMLTEHSPLADREAAARVVSRQAGAMRMLLDDLLDVSRLKLGRLELHRGTVRLASVIESALETTQPMLEALGHRLALSLPEQPLQIEGDALRLSQVISNLLTNAIKYTPPHGSLELKAALLGQDAIITMRDNGVGMEPAQIERMFEMYTQSLPTGDRSHGLGIGLALVRSIVQLHGGKVEAFSEGPGKGSEFRVTLPGARVVEESDSEPPARATPPAAAARPLKKRGLVLIADDNVDAGWGMARLLEIAGFSTVRVKGGLAAVSETRRQKPDVGIIDIGMPDLGGHDVARQIRLTEWGKHMVLIAATGWGQEADEREALAAGFDAHMTKPVDLRKLSKVVDELLARKRG